MIRSLLSGAAALLAVAPAFAHAGFLVPVTEGTDADGKVLLHATFSDAFPQMEIGLTSEAWVIVTPEGERKDFDRMAERPDRTLLQATLEEEGVYRLSSGERLGRKGEVARIEGEYFLLGRDGLTKESLPDGAEVLTSQTATVSDMQQMLITLRSRASRGGASSWFGTGASSGRGAHASPPRASTAAAHMIP